MMLVRLRWEMEAAYFAFESTKGLLSVQSTTGQKVPV